MKDEISIREAQNLVDEWIRTTGVRYFNELTNMAILTEEVGEVAQVDEPYLRGTIISRG